MKAEQAAKSVEQLSQRELDMDQIPANRVWKLNILD
jgi:hypothetical protein